MSKGFPASKMALAIAMVHGWMEDEIPLPTAQFLVDWTTDRLFWRIVTRNALPQIMTEGLPYQSMGLSYAQELERAV